MKQPVDQLPPTAPTHLATKPLKRQNEEIPASAVDHPVLSRLIEEVRNDTATESAYDRVHNRHNRGR